MIAFSWSSFWLKTVLFILDSLTLKNLSSSSNLIQTFLFFPTCIYVMPKPFICSDWSKAFSWLTKKQTYLMSFIFNLFRDFHSALCPRIPFQLPICLPNMFLLFVKFLFWNNHVFTEMCKNRREILFTLHPVSLNSYIFFGNCSFISEKGGWTLVQWVCLVLCHFIICVHSCNHHQNQDTKLLQQRNCLLSLDSHINHHVTPSQSLNPGNH